ncbi:hypothetical protein KsCSTR_37250 [Candidatus Kuenenia stuttgartiensis]|uniref:Uncharacterized protein n=1 Tax=Kuenenia stuttgartiensis TaxID=174633 RepID=Q1Q6A3_KUEST|nr:hypothetical protein KsCSTR_37250 [Candidatus Kuenenia stuttgartiensis]CAJ73095.1 unknown protein [Candidatus Kuenenia stuttgartiensis]
MGKGQGGSRGLNLASRAHPTFHSKRYLENYIRLQLIHNAFFNSVGFLAFLCAFQ